MKRHVILDPEFIKSDLTTELNAIKAELENGWAGKDGDMEVFFETNGSGEIVYREFKSKFPELAKRLIPVRRTAGGLQYVWL